MDLLERLIVNIEGEVREENLEGVPHLVVPMVMLTEGVHEGSEGPGFYSDEENAKSAQLWNHMPVVVYHPREGDGSPITARQPSVLNTRKVGLVLNTTNEDKKLKAEAWLNIARTNEVDKRIIANIKNKVKTEVSTGLGATKVMEKGTWNNEKYAFKVKDYKPDHLAILPDQVGACSIADGAGLLANSKTGPESTVQALNRSCLKVIENTLGFKVINNELSFSTTERMLIDALASKYGERGKYWEGWITEVFSDHVIFYNSDRKLLMVEYTSNGSSVSLKGDAVEVVRVVSYKTVNNQSYVSNGSGVLSLQPEKEQEMSSKFDKKKHVDDLIANKQVKEEDRAAFEALDDEVVSKIAIIKNVSPAPAQTTTTTPVITTGATTEEKKPVKMEDLPVEVQNQVKRGLAAEKREKDRLIKMIQNNEQAKEVWSEEFLLKQDVDFLERLAATSGGTAHVHPSPYGPPLLTNDDYSGASGYIPGTNLVNVGGGKPDPRDEPLPLPKAPTYKK